MIIDLRVTWTDPPDKVSGPALGWGRAQLHVNGKPVWFAGKNAEDHLEWSWIELLEFLALRWPYLTTEQAYPLNLTPDEPRNLRKMLRALVEETSNDSLIDLYDEEVFRFEERHDLSRALRGLHVPSVHIVREGNTAWVATDDVAQRFQLDDVLRDLRLIGDTISERVSADTTSSARATAALRAWSTREAVQPGLIISLATGLGRNEFSQRLPKDSLEFWELQPVAGADSEIACAARMVRGDTASEDDRVVVAREIRRLEHSNTPAADALSAKLKKELDRQLSEDPYQQGYSLALDVRSQLDLREGIVDPEQILRDFFVTVVDIVVSPTVDAVGCWGPKHGPAVLVNQKGKHAATPWGRRATMAHELCHLLVDRSLSLPFAEVLGGRSPYRLERRANAFAAELLLPRWAAREEYSKHRAAKPTLEALRGRFGVGLIMAANQLKNAEPAKITAAELAELGSIVNGDKTYES